MISLMKILAFPNDKITRKEKTNQYTQDLRDQMQEQCTSIEVAVSLELPSIRSMVPVSP